jgi:hypothetical protein
VSEFRAQNIRWIVVDLKPKGDPSAAETAAKNVEQERTEATEIKSFAQTCVRRDRCAVVVQFFNARALSYHHDTKNTTFEVERCLPSACDWNTSMKARCSFRGYGLTTLEINPKDNEPSSLSNPR